VSIVGGPGCGLGESFEPANEKKELTITPLSIAKTIRPKIGRLLEIFLGQHNKRDWNGEEAGRRWKVDPRASPLLLFRCHSDCRFNSFNPPPELFVGHSA
jgi:hypothetical protein